MKNYRQPASIYEQMERDGYRRGLRDGLWLAVGIVAGAMLVYVVVSVAWAVL